MTRPSFQQEGLWAQAQVLEHPEVLNMPSAFRVLGAVDDRRIVRAVERVVARHDALRTTFRLVGGQLRVVVQDGARVDAVLVDMTGASLEHCRERATRDVDEPMDLAFGPLVRLRVYRRSDDDAVLVLTVHHTAVDALSMGMIWHDIVGELSSGDQSATVPLAPSYVAFAEAQRRRLPDAELTELAATRAHDLEGVESYRDAWSADSGDRDEEPSVVGFRVLAPRIAQAVSRAAAHLLVSDFMLMLVVFRVAMWRTTGVADGLVDIPVSGRAEPGTEETVGYFLDLHAIRTGIDADESLADAVGRECNAVLDALETPELASWRLHQALDRTPGRARVGIGDVTFSFRQREDAGLEIENCHVQPFALDSGRPVRALTFDVEALSDGSLAVVAHGDGSVIPTARLDELLRSFCQGLRDVASDPGARLGSVGAVGGERRATERPTTPATPTTLLLKDGPGPTIFLLPALTGSPAVYMDLVDCLPAAVRVWGVSTTAPIVASAGTLEDLAVACADAIRRVQVNGPYTLMGWSLGGALAHAVASALDGDVSLLAMVDTTLWVEEDPSRAAVEHAAEQLGDEVLADGEMLALAAAHLTLLRSHRPHVLPVPVTFVATADTDDDAARWPYAMWGPYVGDLTVLTLTASHDSVLISPAVETLADLVVQATARGKT